MSAPEGEVVCVTGASGCIGSWVVKLLLARGYFVHAAVKNLNDEKETKHLESMEGAKDRLRLFQIELLDYDSLVAAITGCAGAFHLASPCTLDRVKNPQKELLDPAIKGTVNVLRAAKEASLKRVVVTSSSCSIMPSPNWPADMAKTEDCWTDIEYCEQQESQLLGGVAKGTLRLVFNSCIIHFLCKAFTLTRLSSASEQLWYPLSKTLAEKAAWDFSKENGLDVVVVNPGAVMGPVIPPTLNSSMMLLLRLIQGCTETYQDFYMGCAHFEDVALAHVLVYENKSASGRHLCVEAISHFGDFVARVAELYPEYSLPSIPRDTQVGLLREKKGAKKLMDLGLEFIPVEQIIKDGIESLKSRGYLS